MRPGTLFLLCFLLLSGWGHGQALPAADTVGKNTYTYTETMPVFPGRSPADSTRSWNQRIGNFLEDSLRTIPKVLRNGVTGKVFFAFTVDVQGRTTDIHLVKGLRADLDAVVLRNAQRLKQVQWRPGTQNGRPVRVSFTVPVSFNAGSQAPAVPGQLWADSLDGPAFRQNRGLPLNSWGSDRRILPPDRSIIYGSCIQRLGFSSGGFGQYVRLENLSTGKGVSFEVKPPMRTRPQNAFCYVLLPGRYALHTYFFTVSKWYGGEQHQEELRKANLVGQALRATRYVFTVAPGQVYYVGSWDLHQENQPVFRNEKAALDAQLAPIFTHLDFSQSAVALPE